MVGLWDTEEVHPQRVGTGEVDTLQIESFTQPVLPQIIMLIIVLTRQPHREVVKTRRSNDILALV
jgi:hypothetical protein